MNCNFIFIVDFEIEIGLITNFADWLVGVGCWVVFIGVEFYFLSLDFAFC